MSAPTATARRIDGDDLEALQAAVGVLAAKWSVVVLARLDAGSSRFNELLRQIDGVSRRMLSATLRQLERDGLIERHVFARVPARVGYELSPAGQDLLAALGPGIGPCCYEVGEELKNEFGPGGEAFFRPGPRGKPHLDVRAANVAQLKAAGVPEARIHSVAVAARIMSDTSPCVGGGVL
jgi:DNA-binding HxlR family transcriptional regulator